MSDINPTTGPFEAAINNLYNPDKVSNIPAESGFLQGSSSPRANARLEALANTPPVAEREITTIDIGEVNNVPMELMRTIFSYNLMSDAPSYRAWKKEALCICRGLRGYLLKYGNWQVAFRHATFFQLESEKQLEMIDLMQKIGVNFILDDPLFRNEGDVSQSEDVYAAICRAPEIFKQATLTITVTTGAWRWLLNKGEDANFMQRIVGLYLADFTLTESNCKLTLDFITKCIFLKTLKICKIYKGILVTLPRSLIALTTLAFEEICEGVTVNISEGLTALTSLSVFLCQSNNITLTIPLSLKQNLKNLFLDYYTGTLQWV